MRGRFAHRSGGGRGLCRGGVVHVHLHLRLELLLCLCRLLYQLLCHLEGRREGVSPGRRGFGS